MTRAAAIARASACADGAFAEDLARLVAIPTESQTPEGLPHCRRYLTDAMAPAFAAMGFDSRVIDNPEPGGGPVLLATRLEDPSLPTVLGYGHGDVIRGMAGRWAEGRDPWRLEPAGERLYGRGTADNKAQHWIGMQALRAVVETRGRLGFNMKMLIETGEEIGSRGLRAIIEADRDAFAADAMIASDGPRVARDRPTVSLGARGAVNFSLRCDLRAGGHHSGNWGGALADPAMILAHALAAIVDARGRILVEAWRPDPPSPAVRALLDGVTLEAGPDGPTPDPDWGEPGLSPAENVYAFNSVAVLAMEAGDPAAPVNAIAPRAVAHCQLRYIAGADPDGFLPALRAHLDAHGFGQVAIEEPPAANAGRFAASRTEPDDPWALFVRRSVAVTTGAAPAVIPQTGGSICNELFTDVLGIPAIWVPHSYAGCNQHAPDEHVLLPVCRVALAIMAGLWWDIGEAPPG